jgi:hypothetical protein
MGITKVIVSQEIGDMDKRAILAGVMLVVSASAHAASADQIIRQNQRDAYQQCISMMAANARDMRDAGIYSYEEIEQLQDKLRRDCKVYLPKDIRSDND